MGLWDIIKQAPLQMPTTIPDNRIYTDPFRREPTLGDVIGAINCGVKALRNAGRRFKSIFEDDEDKDLKKGDIIGICRGIYDHYGVYIDDGSVIHYSSKDSDTSSNNSIIETDIDTFMRGDGTLFRLSFPEKYGKPRKIVTSYQGVAPDINRIFMDLAKSEQYKLYSPDETVDRARSRLGENQYNFVCNNCEHFAIWCKTGISESHQINAFLEGMRDCIMH